MAILSLLLLLLTAGAATAAPGDGSDDSGGPWFRDAAEEAGVAHPHHNRSFDNPYAHIMEGYTALGASAAVADYDGDGDLDLVLGNYFAPVNLFDPATSRFVPESFETADNGGGVTLYRNDGPGADGVPRFTDVTAAALGIDTKKGMNAGWGWAGKLFDADNDGWRDLYVVNGWVSAGEGNYVEDVFELILRDDVDLAEVTNWPPMGNKTLSGYQRNELLVNRGVVLFEDLAAEHGVDSLRDGRGAGGATRGNRRHERQARRAVDRQRPLSRSAARPRGPQARVLRSRRQAASRRTGSPLRRRAMHTSPCANNSPGARAPAQPHGVWPHRAIRY